MPHHPCAILHWSGLVLHPIPNHWDCRLCLVGPFQWCGDSGTARLGQMAPHGEGTTPAPSSLSGRFYTPAPPNGLCFVSLGSNKTRRQKKPHLPTPSEAPLPGALRFVVPTPQNNRSWNRLQNSPCPLTCPPCPSTSTAPWSPNSPECWEGLSPSLPGQTSSHGSPPALAQAGAGVRHCKAVELGWRHLHRTDVEKQGRTQETSSLESNMVTVTGKRAARGPIQARAASLL